MSDVTTHFDDCRCSKCRAIEEREHAKARARTITLDHPKRCDCYAKNLDPATCDCACHVPTRDNTVTDDDLALDRLKAQLRSADERGAALVVERDELKAQVQSLEYELKDKRGQFDDANRYADRYSAEHHAAVEHLDEFTGLGLVDGIKALRVALITARAELAATKAGADHLQTSLTRALADLAAQDRALTATANELRAERDGARGELARVRATVLEELAKLGVVR